MGYRRPLRPPRPSPAEDHAPPPAHIAEAIIDALRRRHAELPSHKPHNITLLTEELQAAGANATKTRLNGYSTNAKPAKLSSPQPPIQQARSDANCYVGHLPYCGDFSTQTRRLRLTIEDDPNCLSIYNMCPLPVAQPITATGKPSRSPAWLLSARANRGSDLRFIDIPLMHTEAEACCRTHAPKIPTQNAPSLFGRRWNIS